MLTQEGSKSLNKLIYFVFLPALIFVSLGTSVTGSRLLSWWAQMVNVLLDVLLGLGLGALVAPLVRTPQHLHRLFICCAGVGALQPAPLPGSHCCAAATSAESNFTTQFQCHSAHVA